MKPYRATIIAAAAAILAAAAATTSCNRFLDENPRDQIHEEQVRQTLQSVYLNYVASLYTNVGGSQACHGLQGTERGIYDFNTLTSDEAIIPIRGGDWYDGGFWQRLNQHTWGAHDQYLRATWEYMYKVIALSNKSLEVLNESKQQFDASIIDRYMAEVRAFRAMYYYYLLDMFARVPITVSSVVPVAEVRQSARSEVFRFVIDELQQAMPLLSEQHSNRPGAYYGRITQPVANFILAKMMLNAEIYADDNWTDIAHPQGEEMIFVIDGKEYNAWQATIYYCNLITDAGYTLADNYEDNFAVFNESSPENIFVIPTDKRIPTNLSIHLFRSLHYNHAAALGMNGENGTSATLDALRIYGYDTSDEDPRLYHNYYLGAVFGLDGNAVKTDDNTVLEYHPLQIAPDLSGSDYEKTAGARMRKYEVDKTSAKGGTLVDNDIVLFRYADVILMKGEAKLRLGLAADDELNQVRSRAGAPFRTATLKTILDERLLELAWEGWRRQDLIRFRKFHLPYLQRPQIAGEETAFTTVFPIPQDILDLNPNLTQNAGYYVK